MRRIAVRPVEQFGKRLIDDVQRWPQWISASAPSTRRTAPRECCSALLIDFIEAQRCVD